METLLFNVIDILTQHHIHSYIRIPTFIDEETATQKDSVTDSRSQR